MDLQLGDLDLRYRREPTTWVALEATTPAYNARPRRRKGARGRVTAADMESVVSLGGKISTRREQNLRPEQIGALRLKREPKDHSVTCLEKEDEQGNVEYKYRIKDPHPVRLQQLITQMNYRLSEGNGECFYYIGIEDNGYPKGLDRADLEGSIATLHRMAASLAAIVTLVRHIPAAWGRHAALLRVATSTATEAYHIDLRIAVAGSVDAGKSTLVAVLTHGSDNRPLLDNGRGLACMNVFRHKHEMQSGRTSSICHQLLGYDRQGRVLNYITPAATLLTPAEITASAAKVLTFLDMGGHEKYLKTTLYGMTALLPDYSLLCVCAVAGPGRITREHLAVAVALEVPVAVIITKVELVHPERFAAVVAEVRDIVALTLQHESAPPGANSSLGDSGAGDVRRRIEDASPLVTNETDALVSARILCELHAESITSTTPRGALHVHMPIFAVSAVTGSGLSVLHTFLNALQPGTPSKGAGSTPMSPGCPPAGDGLGVRSSLHNSGSREHVLLASAFTDVVIGKGGDVTPANSVDTAQGGSPHTVVPAFRSSSSPDALRNQTHPQQHLYCSMATAAAGAAPFSATASAEAQAVHFQVDGTFEVKGVGSVVSGTLVSGIVGLGQELMLGPTAAGDFTRVVVRQLQRSHMAVQQVRAGQTCTIAISPAWTGQAQGAGLDGGARGVLAGGGRLPQGGGRLSQTLPDGACGMCSSGPSGAMTIMQELETVDGPDGNPVDDFTDALAAAQMALELQLGGISEDDDGGGCMAGSFGEDELFAFDSTSAPEVAALGPRRSTTAVSSQLSFGPPALHTMDDLSASVPPSGSEATSADGVHVQLSLAASQLHSNMNPLSASAPARTLPAAVTRGIQAGSPLAFSGMMPPRKGSVLLEPALKPRTSWAFEAVLILLGGHWPQRSAVSGRWSPTCDDHLVPPQAVRPVCDPVTCASRGHLTSAGAGALELNTLRGCLSGGPDGARCGVCFSSVDCVHRQSDGVESGTTESDPVPPAAPSAVSMPIDVVKRGQDERPGRLAPGRRRRQRGEGAGSYTVMVHCGSVRQPAHVLMIQELFKGRTEDDGSGSDRNRHLQASCPELRISASTRAAAALLQGVRETQIGPPTCNVARSSLSSHAGKQDLGCLVRVVMRWQHRAEWLREGTKLLVCDRCDCRVAGTGFVQRVLF